MQDSSEMSRDFLLFSSVQHPQNIVNLSSDVSLVTSHYRDGKSVWGVSRFLAAAEQLTLIPIVPSTYLDPHLQLHLNLTGF